MKRMRTSGYESAEPTFICSLSTLLLARILNGCAAHTRRWHALVDARLWQPSARGWVPMPCTLTCVCKRWWSSIDSIEYCRLFVERVVGVESIDRFPAPMRAWLAPVRGMEADWRDIVCRILHHVRHAEALPMQTIGHDFTEPKEPVPCFPVCACTLPYLLSGVYLHSHSSPATVTERDCEEWLREIDLRRQNAKAALWACPTEDLCKQGLAVLRDLDSQRDICERTLRRMQLTAAAPRCPPLRQSLREEASCAAARVLQQISDALHAAQLELGDPCTSIRSWLFAVHEEVVWLSDRLARIRTYTPMQKEQRDAAVALARRKRTEIDFLIAALRMAPSTF